MNLAQAELKAFEARADRAIRASCSHLQCDTCRVESTMPSKGFVITLVLVVDALLMRNSAAAAAAAAQLQQKPSQARSAWTPALAVRQSHAAIGGIM